MSQRPKRKSVAPVRYRKNEEPEPSEPCIPIAADLPAFVEVNRVPDQDIYGMSGAEFVTVIDSAYERMLKWKKNLFKIPSGNASKTFVKLLAKWLHHFNTETEFKGIALKVYHVLPSLFLQKPSKNSKARDHLRCLERRLESWNNGDIPSLVTEAQTIQNRLQKLSPLTRSPDDTARIFARQILQGKVHAALKLISEDGGQGVHTITDEVMADLHDKHPIPAPISEGTLLFGPVNLVHDCFLMRSMSRLS